MKNKISIIPQPVGVENKSGTFTFNQQTEICYKPFPGIGKVAEYLSDYLKSAESPVECKCTECSNCINFRINSDLPFESDEGYKLGITESNIFIEAKALSGLFYAVQTLKQIMPPEIISNKLEEISIPCVEIIDYPRFKWRGMHLDTARHIFSVSAVKSFIDMLAFNKMNKFHWHLTEDQGWRIEIKKYPELTKISSKRKATPVLGDRETLDGIPYDGFYTQEEAKEIVRYAAIDSLRLFQKSNFQVTL